MPPQDDGSDARWEHRNGQTCHGPERCGPTSDSSHTAIQPQTTTDGDREEDDHQHLGAIRRGGAVLAREVRQHVTFVAT